MRKSLFVMVGLRVSAVACLFLMGWAVVLAPSLALAADGQTYAIDTGPLISAAMPFLEAALMAVVTAATAWLSRKAHQYFGVQIEAKHRAALNEVIWSRFNQLSVVASARSPTLYTRQAALAAIANYVIEKVPDAIKYFGLDEEGVRAMVLGRLTDQIDKLTGDDNGDLASASASVPSGYPSAPVDLSQAVAGSATAPQAGG
ncbi:hypothetical protein [Cohaesibacter marisflavi]|uniref:hypothetical protein n=1 Tax=Cohaesibacter marisflavi TaxID=655353 RepID=UPI0029C7C2AE|nr:hypothetical protein [Cohaesibacter marisflavi]